MKLVFATANQHKAAEIAAMLPIGYQLLSLKDLDFYDEIEETGATLHENAAIKAKTIFEKYNLPVFADDTGLMVAALDGRPGVYSARFAGPNATYKDNCDLLLSELNQVENRNAYFQTVICFINADGNEQYFEGTVHGAITPAPSGNQGFGYDPIFQPENSNLTFAEMPSEKKNAMSHRARAFHAFLTYLNNTQS
ncbi:MAG: RdgB/HAM1 family non-canonical purine NTP pyrophosphatase [Bacteroidia bacterium]|jgi:XTP/dITP diphosphohydrolase